MSASDNRNGGVITVKKITNSCSSVIGIVKKADTPTLGMGNRDFT